MNKRQEKKHKKMLFGDFEKVRPIVKVDLTNVSDNSHIDVFIPTKYEGSSSERRGVLNEIQNKWISPRKWEAKGKSHCIQILNGFDKHIDLTVWLMDVNIPYTIKPITK